MLATAVLTGRSIRWPKGLFPHPDAPFPVARDSMERHRVLVRSLCQRGNLLYWLLRHPFKNLAISISCAGYLMHPFKKAASERSIGPMLFVGEKWHR